MVSKSCPIISEITLCEGFRTTLNILAILSGSEPHVHPELKEKMAKSYILLLSKFEKKAMGFNVPFLKYKHSELKLRVFLVGNTVDMAIYCVPKMLTPCWPVIGQFFLFHNCSLC